MPCMRANQRSFLTLSGIVTPELLATTEFRKYISALYGREMVARLVIDEVFYHFLFCLDQNAALSLKCTLTQI